jgi:hypothetical protein
MAQAPDLEQKVAQLEKKVKTLEIAAMATLIFIFVLNLLARF